MFLLCGLPKEREVLAEKIVQNIWDSGDWQEVMWTRLGFKKEMDGSLLARWVRKLEFAKQNNVTVTAEEFAIQTVDANFAHWVVE